MPRDLVLSVNDLANLNGGLQIRIEIGCLHEACYKRTCLWYDDYTELHNLPAISYCLSEAQKQGWSVVYNPDMQLDPTFFCPEHSHAIS